MRLTNTKESLWFLFKLWTSERLTRKDGSARKRTPKEVVTLRLCASLFSFIFTELAADTTVEASEVDYLMVRFLSGQHIRRCPSQHITYHMTRTST